MPPEERVLVEVGNGLIRGAAASQERVVARVFQDARRVYGDTIAEETLAAWARTAVAEVWGDSVKVTSFVPVLAMRQISRRVAEASEEALS
jgi:hypothetical protein